MSINLKLFFGNQLKTSIIDIAKVTFEYPK